MHVKSMHTDRITALSLDLRESSMKRWIAPLIVLAFVAGPLKGASPMNEQQARARAATILMGDPYGATEAQVAEAISDAELIADGTTLCGEIRKPVWRFHVVVEKPVTNPDSPIDGQLFIDATSGEVVCTNLPMLD